MLNEALPLPSCAKDKIIAEQRRQQTRELLAAKLRETKVDKPTQFK